MGAWIGSRGKAGCFGTSVTSARKLSHGAGSFELVTLRAT